MIKRLIMLAVVVTALLFSSMSAIGCGDTWHGFGKDVEDVGEDIQD